MRAFIRCILAGLALVGCSDGNSNPLQDDAGSVDIQWHGDPFVVDGSSDDTFADSDRSSNLSEDRVLAEAECRSSADCTDYQDCVPPDPDTFPTGVCGACFSEDNECDTDDDCGPGFACRHEGGCGCGVFVRICVDGCQDDSECLTRHICDEDRHCVDRPCVDDEECPDHFVCAERTCARRGCTQDRDCPGDGWCVGERCYAEHGACVEPVIVP